MKGLTEAEHEAMALLAAFWNLMCQEVVGDGPSRDGDLNEAIHHVHALQHTVLAQAAAREHPKRYRLLGEVVK